MQRRTRQQFTLSHQFSEIGLGRIRGMPSTVSGGHLTSKLTYKAQEKLSCDTCCIWGLISTLHTSFLAVSAQSANRSVSIGMYRVGF